MNESVAVLGGGVAGLTAAHELIERGFEVTVYERRPETELGGKARSFGSDQGTGGPLPAEHGFRFFPGFYRHLPDTMRRIPYPGCKEGVLDNLVEATTLEVNFAREKHRLRLPFVPSSLGQLRELLGMAWHMRKHFTRDDLDAWAWVIWRLLSSCEERRAEKFEGTSWSAFVQPGPPDFMQPPALSANYKTVVEKIVRALVAADPAKGSARTLGDIFLQMVFDLAGLGNPPDRILNGPTNEVWIDPWRAYLHHQMGVVFKQAEVTAFKVAVDEHRIVEVLVTEGGSSKVVTADYYIAALPVEAMRTLLTPELIAADSNLAKIEVLARDHTEWMTGIQFYLEEDPKDTTPIHGHQMHLESPWALTSLSSDLFWKKPLCQYGDGSLKSVISVDISDWNAPGGSGVSKRTAKQCTRDEIATEVWTQLRASRRDLEVLRDARPLYHLDPAIVFAPGKSGTPVENTEPLLVNGVGTWDLRPEARTRIRNLMLASDYVRTFTDLATMEGANEAARRAVNAIIDESGAAVPVCDVMPQYEPLALKPLRWLDRWRYLRNQEWDKSTPVIVRTAQAMASAGLLTDAARSRPPRPGPKDGPRPPAAPDDVQSMLGDLLFDHLRPALAAGDVEALRRLFAPDAALWLDERLLRIEDGLGWVSTVAQPGLRARLDVIDVVRIEMDGTLVRAVFAVELEWGEGHGAGRRSPGRLHLTVERVDAKGTGPGGRIRDLGWVPFSRGGEER